VQTVGDERDRAEQQAADDLGRHHDDAQRDHGPSAALVARMAGAEEDVAVSRLAGPFVCAAHAGLRQDHFR
jgi:hypothetical protein